MLQQSSDRYGFYVLVCFLSHFVLFLLGGGYLIKLSSHIIQVYKVRFLRSNYSQNFEIKYVEILRFKKGEI